MNIDDKTLCWLAGLFEGEAHFGAATPSEPTLPRVSIHMTDEDVIARVANVFGHKYTLLYPKQERWNPTYKVTLKGAPGAAFMRQLRPLMGQRRQSQIDRALAEYIERPNTRITTPKLTQTQVQAIKQRLATGETAKSIAEDFPVSHYTIWGIRCGKTWKHVTSSQEIDNYLHAEPAPFALDSDERRFYWLVGLLEGEGSFMRGAPSSPNNPRISVAMTDEDVIERVAQICEVKYQSLRSRSMNHKNVYRAYIKGRKAVSLIRQLYPLMGKRRQQQIDAALDSYVEIPVNRGMYNPSAKLSEGQAREIKVRLLKGESIQEIAQDYQVSISIVREITLGRTWKHIQVE